MKQMLQISLCKNYSKIAIERSEQAIGGGGGGKESPLSANRHTICNPYSKKQLRFDSNNGLLNP